MLKVLMFIIERYPDREVLLSRKPQELMGELEKAGFNFSEIRDTYRWLEGMRGYQSTVDPTVFISVTRAERLYSDFEMDILDAECRDYLFYLERCKILDSYSRELVIDRLLALQEKVVAVSDVKWVTLLVLFHLPDRKEQLSAMQDFVLFGGKEKLH